MFAKKSILSHPSTPAPQPFDASELTLICDLLRRADMEVTETMIKLYVFRDYALERESAGQRHISLTAQ